MTRSTRRIRLISLVAVAALGVAACGSDDEDAGSDSTEAPTSEAPETTGAPAPETTLPAESTPETTPTSEEPTETTGAPEPGGVDESICDASAAPADATPIKLQLQWYNQAQFAGYLAADALGCFAEAGVDVELLEGAVEITPQVVLSDGQADFAIAWVPKALQTNESTGNLINIAQIFQRSGTLGVSFADAGITSVADYAGKRVGNWGFGNEYEIFAALAANSLTPGDDVTLVGQQFDMSGLLSGDIDVAEAMTYNEYAQVLETINPDTGELYTADDLNVISYEDEGVGMLQDALWADSERLANDADYQAAAAKVLEASLRGWIYCRDNPEACVDIVTEAGSTLGASHQLWQMNEVNKLIWPSPLGVGTMDPDLWDQTISIALATPNADGDKIITADPGVERYTTDLAATALAAIMADGIDVIGADFTPLEVTLNEGGN